MNERDEALHQLKYHLIPAQEKMKRYADKKEKRVTKGLLVRKGPIHPVGECMFAEESK